MDLFQIKLKKANPSSGQISRSSLALLIGKQYYEKKKRKITREENEQSLTKQTLIKQRDKAVGLKQSQIMI